jgi:hypothetical protein
MQFQGTVLEGDRVIVRDVQGTYQFDSATGASVSWSGRMSVPAGAAMPDGETYTLRLTDGRERTITVSGGTNTDAGATVWFKGKGRAP